MSYHTKLLSILMLILLYSDYITFWLAGSVSPLVLETGLEYGSSSELKGEYFVVFLAEELLYKYIYVYFLVGGCGFMGCISACNFY
jgi:hypothetical protein